MYQIDPATQVKYFEQAEVYYIGHAIEHTDTLKRYCGHYSTVPVILNEHTCIILLIRGISQRFASELLQYPNLVYSVYPTTSNIIVLPHSLRHNKESRTVYLKSVAQQLKLADKYHYHDLSLLPSSIETPIIISGNRHLMEDTLNKMVKPNMDKEFEEAIQAIKNSLPRKERTL